MSKKQVNFSLDDMTEARFRQSLFGYNQQDVEDFLDKVVEDYQAFILEIELLNEEIDNLKKGYRYTHD